MLPSSSTLVTAYNASILSCSTLELLARLLACTCTSKRTDVSGQRHTEVKGNSRESGSTAVRPGPSASSSKLALENVNSELALARVRECRS
ncbi:hypothetical protein CY34DRAFT_809795 [Suillus luteus UH-Slu-Lm8-n1]|uniref:Uncharacterized protein n=1 Tax=Suillus luteus UH-Slu-Lm8-n1 TaxID=930992 RepID=A0A0D0B242_9AGAM|nr:hypothetical protein CY34DRAFT_809795 [Suillus luteus UH-Slu-Lm8-n1]